MRHEFGLPALPFSNRQARICNPNVPAIEAQALSRASARHLCSLRTRPRPRPLQSTLEAVTVTRRVALLSRLAGPGNRLAEETLVLLRVPLEHELATCARSHANLVAYEERMARTCFALASAAHVPAPAM
jgi:hypothetical protein